MVKEEVIQQAFSAMPHAYAPYSHFHVGACVMCKDASFYIGVNVENASYGLTCCAERNALFAAYASGKRKADIVAMAIVTDKERIATPCGACRQVLAELLDAHTPIYLSNGKETMTTDIATLLPMAFTLEDSHHV